MSPRRRPARAWPWKQDTGLERRERVARHYRERLAEVAPAEAEQLDALHAELGQTWVLPARRALPDDEQLDTAAVAEHFDTTPRQIDRWRSQGLRAVRTVDGLRYTYGDVVAFLADRRRRRQPPPNVQHATR